MPGVGLVVYFVSISATLCRRLRHGPESSGACTSGTSPVSGKTCLCFRRERARESGRNEGASLPDSRRKTGRDGPSSLPTSKQPLRAGRDTGTSCIVKMDRREEIFHMGYDTVNKPVTLWCCACILWGRYLSGTPSCLPPSLPSWPALRQVLRKPSLRGAALLLSEPYEGGIVPCTLLTFRVCHLCLLTFGIRMLMPLWRVPPSPLSICPAMHNDNTSIPRPYSPLRVSQMPL